MSHVVSNNGWYFFPFYFNTSLFANGCPHSQIPPFLWQTTSDRPCLSASNLCGTVSVPLLFLMSTGPIPSWVMVRLLLYSFRASFPSLAGCELGTSPKRLSGRKQLLASTARVCASLGARYLADVAYCSALRARALAGGGDQQTF